MSRTDRELELIRRFNEPAPVGAQFGITRHLLEVYERRTDVQEVIPDLDRDGAAFVEWLWLYGRYQEGLIDELLPPRPEEYRHFTDLTPPRAPAPVAREWGVNIIGYHEAEVGIGEAGRLVIAGLDACEVPLLPVAGRIRPLSRHGHRFEAVTPAAAGFPIHLLCVNPVGIKPIVGETSREFLADRYSIGYFWWETDGPLPFEWRTEFDLLDEVWVGTEYVADCLREQLPMPVSVLRLPVEVPTLPAVSRTRLGFPEEFVFLFVFDYMSTLKRKNPLAVIEAFRRAFAPGDGAALVIKCVNSGDCRPDHARVMAAAAGHAGVRVIDDYVSSAMKNAMIAACDCYVSLHRAEGLGLTAAEAMYLGKPVIATGYSGNLDFMTPENSHLVDYTMTEVGRGAWPYPENGTWAEPDVEHAARLMRQVFDDPVGARVLGARGARDIRATHAPGVAGEAMAARLGDIAASLKAGEPGEPGEAGEAERDGVGAAAAVFERGPVRRGDTTLGPVRELLRRLILRALKPYTAYQRQLDEELVAGLAAVDRTAEQAGAQALARVQALERAISLARADELRARRRANSSGSAGPTTAELSRSPAATSDVCGPGAPGRAIDPARAQRVQAQVDAIPFWWHTIDLGDGVLTPGHRGDMTDELRGLELPDMTGKEVLDIGAWDGFYSFEAERRGARRVLALDHFAWSTDMTHARGGLINPGIPDLTRTPAWQPETLPGKRGFDLARETLDSRVEPVVADFMTADLDELGSFDVVLFLGVLYHMRNPLGAMERLAAVTREVAVIESEAIWVADHEDRPLCEFFAADQLGGDHSNWWAPNLAALLDLALAGGFGRVQAIQTLAPQLAVGPGPVRYRAVVHAFK